MTNKKKFFLLLMTFIFLAGIFFGLFFYKSALKFYINQDVNIDDQSSIDYNVYLKDNDFFTEEFLPKDEVYISSLIDYLDIYFNYNLTFDEGLTGNYTYYVKGVISADLQNNNGKYWSREYVLSEPVTENLINSRSLVVSKNIKINYDEYNNILVDFKKEYNLTFDGNLTLYLCVKSDFENEWNEIKLEDESNISLSIPLTTATIEVPIEINNSRNSNVLKLGMVYVDYEQYKNNMIYTCLSFVIGLIALVYIIISLCKNHKKLKDYEKEVKKILKTYNGIIVNIKNAPDIKGEKVYTVDTFDELIDAHSEVRMPINFYEDAKCAQFVLYNSDIVWKYTINKRGKHESK